MNELIFVGHVIFILLTLLVALRLGMGALISIVSLFTILANLFVQKQIMLFGLSVTASDAFIVGGILGLNLIHEYFGFQEAKKAIWISFFCSIVYLFLSQIHLLYTPSAIDYSQVHFEALLFQMPRIIIASLFTYLIVQLSDTLFYRFMKNIFSGRYLTLRSLLSLLISQFFDTVLFSVLGLWGLVASIKSIIIVSYAIKLIVIAFSVPFIALSAKFFKPKSNKI